MDDQWLDHSRLKPQYTECPYCGWQTRAHEEYPFIRYSQECENCGGIYHVDYGEVSQDDYTD